MTDPLARQLADTLDVAFVDLVDTYGSMVLTLAVRLTDRPTGEDIAQEAFLRAYRALRSYDETQISRLDIRPWLATITRNLVKNEYRRQQRKPEVGLDHQNEQVEAATDRAIEIVDASDAITNMLATLPENQRDAVVLRHIVGLPMREVALTLVCPEGTAKSHVARGLSRLRDFHKAPGLGNAESAAAPNAGGQQ